MPNPREALTKADRIRRTSEDVRLESHASGRGRSAPNHNLYATLHVYHRRGGWSTWKAEVVGRFSRLSVIGRSPQSVGAAIPHILYQ